MRIPNITINLESSVGIANTGNRVLSKWCGARGIKPHSIGHKCCINRRALDESDLMGGYE